MLHSIYEQSPIAIQVYDAKGILVDVNQQTLTLFGVADKESLLGYEMWSSQSFTPETIAEVRNGRSVHIATSLDFEAVKKAGLFPTTRSGVIYLDLHIFPLVIASKVQGYSVQLIDITERKIIEAQLLQAQKMESIGRLAGGIAHDFNNILVPITCYTEMALNQIPDDHPTYFGLTQVRDAADRAARLTNQILAFSRKQILNPQSLNLNTVIADFREMLRRLIGETVQLTVSSKADRPLVNVDKIQIEQALMNLVVNARDAMPRGGTITIRTANVELDESGDGHGFEQDPGRYVVLSVTDTGHGMDEQTRRQIFEPFFTTKEDLGSGLGLSTTFGIVKQHGGSMGVSSTPGKGSTFTIYLPEGDSPRAHQSRTPALGWGHGTETILVVEDDEMVRRLSCKGLAASGYTVIEAATPGDALRLAAERRGEIDLLLTDIVMPEMSGLDLYHRVADVSSQIKVLYMSGYAEDSDFHHIGEHNGDEFLQKPFTISRLTQKVRQTLGNKD